MYKDIKVDPAQLEAALDARLKSVQVSINQRRAWLRVWRRSTWFQCQKSGRMTFYFMHTVTRKAARCLMCSKKASMQLSLPQTQTSELTFHVIAFGKMAKWSMKWLMREKFIMLILIWWLSWLVAVFIWNSFARSGYWSSPYSWRYQCADVFEQYRVRTGRAYFRKYGGFHATNSISSN